MKDATGHNWGRKGRWNSEIKKLRDRVATLEEALRTLRRCLEAGPIDSFELSVIDEVLASSESSRTDKGRNDE